MALGAAAPTAAAGAGTKVVGMTAAGAVAFASVVLLAGNATMVLFAAAAGSGDSGAAALPTADVALAGTTAAAGARTGDVATTAGSVDAAVIAGAVALAAGRAAAGCGATTALGATPRPAGAMSALGAKTGALMLAGIAPGSLASSAAGACSAMPHWSADGFAVHILTALPGILKTLLGPRFLMPKTWREPQMLVSRMFCASLWNTS